MFDIMGNTYFHNDVKFYKKIIKFQNYSIGVCNCLWCTIEKININEKYTWTSIKGEGSVIKM